MAGRPRRTAEVTPLFLRIPPDLLARVDRCQALLQLQSGVRHTRTMAVEVLLGMGCATIEAEILKISEISHIHEILEIPHAIEIEQEPAWDPPPPGPATAESAAPLPAHVQRIAELAAEYDKLSLAELAQLLFDRGIYRATDRATGADKPVNRGTLTRWLAQAREAGVL